MGNYTTQIVKTRVAQSWATANAVAKIKADASKVLAKLAGPKVDIETYMERGEWESVPQFMKLKVDN